MLYLVTGGMGAGKTLFSLKWARELQQSTNRPVCYTSVLRLKGEALTWGWKQIEFADWQQEPDGTIFVIDECHEVLPVRGAGAKAPPDHIQALARHRHRGFDFFLITQHPKNMDSFVRRLIADPGWHRHLKRRSGAKLVAVLEWPNVYEKCESNTAGKSASVDNKAYPKEVFEWYESASIHTAKMRIPKQLWIILAALIAVPLCIFFAIQAMRGDSKSASTDGDKSKPGMFAGLMPGSGNAASGAPGAAPPMTAEQYAASFRPRIPDLPHTAPRYDELTKPKQAPYPAACVQMGSRCQCYTQQATPLNISQDLCQIIVKQGIFLDWLPAAGEGSAVAGGPGAPAPIAPAPARSSASPAAPVQVASSPTDVSGWEERKAQENARVVSRFAPSYPGR
ncbi:MAG: zonular occludens toxin domain-containing protein [Comamonas sp.]|uniref:zonular occludens toxin domain-containing protein n=1 Tax=Comamonas sp. TaxID=34028 RepID=UPI003D101865